jgi:hypothetical protein
MATLTKYYFCFLEKNFFFRLASIYISHSGAILEISMGPIWHIWPFGTFRNLRGFLKLILILETKKEDIES